MPAAPYDPVPKPGADRSRSGALDMSPRSFNRGCVICVLLRSSVVEGSWSSSLSLSRERWARKRAVSASGSRSSSSVSLCAGRRDESGTLLRLWAWELLLLLPLLVVLLLFRFCVPRKPGDLELEGVIRGRGCVGDRVVLRCQLPA